MSAYETGARKAIPAVLIYAQQGERILMLHRNAKDLSQDYHSGKWNGLGGKLEADESPIEAARRELREESGLDLPEDAFVALGAVHFPNFKPKKNEDWIVYVFRANVPGDYEAGALSGDEGELHWIETERLMSLNLWAGDQHFLPHVMSGTPFMGTIWYQGEEVSRYWVQMLGQN